ncbi:MAG: hypothetical protein AUJ56_01290 [Zetaproteobacteria bacterium CG1_02_49_23]|nr:MAG: hypothetical protein AUJ56_01290 [Zetaproteobacteria bacterium CG1_02_49_23]
MNQHNSNIRNIALLDHEGAGETTLLESMLHVAGITNRMGNIDDHNTLSDYDPDEKAYEKSLYCSTLSFDYEGAQFNCLDVPGSADAVAEAMTALHAVECALVCVDAIDGVKANTRKVWRLAAQRGIPRVIAMTKLDAEHADFATALAAIKADFGNRCIPLYIPNASSAAFSELFSVLHSPETNAETQATHEQIVEAIVETDDALMERYLEGESISEQELMTALRDALMHGSLFPVIATSAAHEIGTVQLLEVLKTLAPAPGEIERMVYLNGEPVSVDQIEGFSAYVYHTEADEFVGRVSYLRVLSGTLSTHDSFINRRSGNDERAGHIFRVLGKKQDDLKQAVAGDLVAIPRIADMHACDVITDAATEVSLDEMTFPMPMVSLAVRPNTNKDDQKLGSALHEFENDDRTFHVHSDPITHDLIISGMSDLHLRLILGKLERRYKVQVTTSTPSIAYMATITSSVKDVDYTHKKQSGGAGQFAKVVIDMEPLGRGEGYAFVDKIHGGVIDAVFRTSVDKGVQAAMEEGVMGNYPATDVRVTLVDGKMHTVDSKDIAFQIAGNKAFRKAFMECNPVLLEPIVNMLITVSQDHIGDIIGDLNSRRAQILSTDMEEQTALIKAQAPMAEIQSYQAQLKAMTGGEGTYTIEFDRYEIVPPAIQKRIIEKQD